MTTQHTPGPWLIDADGDIQSGIGDKLADMHITTPANRAVMVAAPRLLAALRACVDFIENDPGDDPDRERKFFRCRELWREAFAQTRGRV